MVRTTREKVVDSLLTLYLLRDAFSRIEVGCVEATRLQKLVFLSELPMILQRKQGFNFRFIRLTYGPYSQELENEANRLVKAGLLDGMSMQPTESAVSILEHFHEVVHRNDAFFGLVRQTNDDWARMDLDLLLRTVHEMPWRGGRTIHDLPPRTPMLYPMNPQRVLLNFDVTEEEVEGLWMNFDPKIAIDFTQAMTEVRSGQLRTHKQLFCTLRR
jgi:uncharacterized protein YwgA